MISGSSQQNMGPSAASGHKYNQFDQPGQVDQYRPFQGQQAGYNGVGQNSAGFQAPTTSGPQYITNIYNTINTNSITVNEHAERAKRGGWPAGQEQLYNQLF